MLMMYQIFNHCFKNGIVPSTWNKSVITPILKPGKDKYNPLSYRGISLLSCVGKVYSSLIERRISKYCETLCLLADEQNGFRRGRSCSEHIFVLTSLINNRLQLGLDTYIALIDMKMAFDRINRDLLMYRLLEMNIDGKIYNAIKALYCNNTAYVRLRYNLCTDSFSVHCGNF